VIESHFATVIKATEPHSATVSKVMQQHSDIISNFSSIITFLISILFFGFNYLLLYLRRRNLKCLYLRLPNSVENIVFNGGHLIVWHNRSIYKYLFTSIHNNIPQQ